MTLLNSPDLHWLVIAVHLVGIACTWAARASEGSSGHTACQCLYFLCLGLVGVSAILCMQLSASLWLLSAGTLGTMIVGATCHGRRAQEPVIG